MGKGNWAKVPWISILDKRATTTTQEGIYVVFLIAEDLSGVFVTLIQGMARLVEEQGQPGALKAMDGLAAELRAGLGGRARNRQAVLLRDPNLRGQVT